MIRESGPALAALVAAAALAAGAAAATAGPAKDERKEPPRVALDEAKRVCVDGKPFFPVGLYAVPPERLDRARELGFNTVHTYAGEGSKDRDSAAPAEKMKAYLDEAGKRGLKVFLGLPRFQVVKGQAARLEERIRLLKDHPALLAWYLFDEPLHQKVPAAAVQASADLIKKHDPDRPTVLVLCLVHDRRERHRKNPEYLACADVLMTDNYPVRAGNSDLSTVTREIEVTRGLLKDRKPIWNVVQLHGRGPGGRGYGLLEPAAAQVRNMVYQSLAAGAKGLTFFACSGSQFDLTKSAEGMKSVRRVTAELRELSPVLLSDRPKTPPLVAGKNDALRTRAFVHEGRAYLLAVNLRYAATRVTVSAPSGRLPAEVRVLFEERTVRTEAGRFTDEIGPIGARVYEAGLGKAGR